MEYSDFLKTKQITVAPSGFEVEPDNPHLFDFQRDLVRWALRIGKAAIWSDCGTGKSIMELCWADHVVRQFNQPVLILAPLSVSHQMQREGIKFGVESKVVTSNADIDGPGIYITNYEKLHRFDTSVFPGVVLDESSILKSFNGATRNELIERFRFTPMRLCCSATPSPNDQMENGNHAEFLGVLTRTEMLSTFFVHDGGDTSKWRLKGHAEEEYWKWVCQWAVTMRRPSDLGYSDEGFILPPLNMTQHVVKNEKPLDGMLFLQEAQTLIERRGARRDSIQERVKLLAGLIEADKSGDQWVIWAGLNTEQDAIAKVCGDQCVSIYGSLSDSEKEKRLAQWLNKEKRTLISKVSIFGWGLNLQQCHNVASLGLSDSFEEMYQGIRRCWRFGQTEQVNYHVITSEAEGAVVRNVQRKEADAATMAREMIKHMSVYNAEAVHGETIRTADVYKEGVEEGNGWTMHLGDSVDHMKEIADDSIHYQLMSLPFESLYTYSASERDMGNCRTTEEFWEHYQFLVAEQVRVLMPGRLISLHCMNLPTSKERDGVIGLRDFRGEIIRAYVKAGLIYHSEVCIWTDPVTAMQRTKALGLLHKQLKKDSCRSRQGIPDYLVTMRKPGDNPERVTHTNETFPVSVWQRYASPVWFDIKRSKTLTREGVREDADERHICALQLEVIERAIDLWTNLGDLVLDPFGGIGSTGYVAIQRGRRFLGIELKESYFKQAVINLKNAENALHQDTLFAETA